MQVASQTTIDAFFVWDALSNIRSDPSAAGLVYPTDDVNSDQMPTAEMFGCTTQGCGAMFNYVVWHEIARVLGFYGVPEMQEMNPGIDFGQPPHAGDVLQSVYSSYAGLPAGDNDPGIDDRHPRRQRNHRQRSASSTASS